MEERSVFERLEDASPRVRRLYACNVYMTWLREIAESSICDKAVQYAMNLEDRKQTPEILKAQEEYTRVTLAAHRESHKFQGGHPPHRVEIAREIAVIVISQSSSHQQLFAAAWACRAFLGEHFDFDLLHDLAIDDPQKRGLAVGPVVSVAIDIAREIYQTQDYAGVGVLADAVEDCDLPESWSRHLRSGERHWRGCWVIDSLLGKN